jgi:hypothetical protein
MRHRFNHLAIAIAGVFAVSFWAHGFLGGDANNRVYLPYVGALHLDGSPVSGEVDLTFEVWDAAAGGTRCHQQNEAQLTVAAGAFNVQIGPLPDACLTDDAVWVAIIDSGNTGNQIGTRQRVMPAAAAASSGTGDFYVPGALDAAGGVYGDNAFIGQQGHGATWAGFSHANMIGPGNYALMQRSTSPPSTLLNAGAGGSIELRIDNATRLTLSTAGVLTTSSSIRNLGADGELGASADKVFRDIGNNWLFLRTASGGDTYGDLAVGQLYSATELTVAGEVDIVGGYAGRQLGTTYTESTDGFIVGYAERGAQAHCYVTVTVGGVSFPLSNRVEAGVAGLNFSFPVPGGTGYRADNVGGFCTGTLFYFVPMGS